MAWLLPVVYALNGLSVGIELGSLFILSILPRVVLRDWGLRRPGILANRHVELTVSAEVYGPAVVVSRRQGRQLEDGLLTSVFCLVFVRSAGGKA